MRRRACRRAEEVPVHGRPALGEARAVEKPLVVERVGDRLDALARQQRPVPSHDRLLDLEDRVLAVEERDDLQQRRRQDDDRVGVPRGIAERDTGAALVLDGEGVHPAETRKGFGHYERKVSAEAT